MDLSIPDLDFQSPLSTSKTPVFGDNVQDLLNVGTLQVNPSSIITVNSIVDVVDDHDGVTTLREAINFANADALEDLIVFERSVFSTAQTISLELGELDITHNLNIIAPRDELTGENLVTVSGNNASRVFKIEEEATVNLNGLIVADGSVTDESGGGINNFGTLTLHNSIVRNNSSIGGRGGGIFNVGNLTVSNSILSGNSAGSFGGGIYNGGDRNVTVSNSTLSDNSASIGGGIDHFGAGNLTVSNSTLSGNSASRGGGIFFLGEFTLVFSTITLNRANIGGGVAGFSIVIEIPSSVRNTIIAGNLSNTGGVNFDVDGNNFTSDGYNLIGNSTNSTGFGATGDILGTSDNPIDPRLAPLDFYGGSTQTIALLPDSPAIDAGDPTVLDTDPTTDQRGLPRVINGRVDIGAFEFSFS